MTDQELRTHELIEKVRTLTAASWDNERIVQYLFDVGLSKGDAIVALSRGSGVPREDAMRIVHHSKAYEARRDIDALWRDTLLACLEDDDFIASLEAPPHEPSKGQKPKRHRP